MNKKLGLLAAAAALVLMPSAPSHAAVNTIVAVYSSQLTNSFATPVVVAARAAGPVTLLNEDLQPHNVASDAIGPDTQPWCQFYATGACPLFRAPVTDAAGHQSTVRGLENAEAGISYAFHCELYPDSPMPGTLLVL
jgi:hypothetical protein